MKNYSHFLGVISPFLGITGFLLAFFFWWKPRQPNSKSRGRISREIRVAVSNQLPVFDVGLRSERVGDHLVGITVKNLSDRRHLIVNWAIGMTKKANLFVVEPVHWDPKLPCWIEPGQSLTFHAPADELRSAHVEKEIPFKKMKPWVEFGDGTRIHSKSSVPLK